MQGRERDININYIPSKSRRLDSIGWLIQGTEVCGAACFDGERLLLATNSTRESELVRDITKFLTNLSISAKVQYSESKEPPVNYRRWKEDNDQRIEAIKDKYWHRFKGIGTYFRDFSEALEKVTNSIILAYSDPTHDNAFSQELVGTIEKRRYRFIQGKERVHAEMKIIQKLMESRKISSRTAVEEQIYIGISKRCCLKCEEMIKAINEAAEELKYASIRELIGVRDVHKQVFPAGIPKFVELGDNTLKDEFRRSIREKFLEKIGARDLEEAFTMKRSVTGSQIHRRSSSPAGRYLEVEPPEALTKSYDISSSSSKSTSVLKEEEQGQKDKKRKRVVDSELNDKESKGKEKEAAETEEEGMAMNKEDKKRLKATKEEKQSTWSERFKNHEDGNRRGK